ncbi:MAG: hypothetical protein PHW31_00120 [Candidatus Pacebacteria bacterium]|nr:hypothetical protein [Candidatus Paceibacterota bacterium]
MFCYIASLGIIVGFLVGLLFIFLAIVGLVKIQRNIGVARIFFKKQTSAQVKMAALMLLGFFLIIAGLLILKAKNISWAGEIVFGIVGLVFLWRLRYIQEEFLRIIVAMAGISLLTPPLY